jgi:hypothetical protein
MILRISYSLSLLVPTSLRRLVTLKCSITKFMLLLVYTVSNSSMMFGWLSLFSTAI